MITEPMANDIPEENLQCEYCVQVLGRFTETVCLKGAFDMPLALGKGQIGSNHYRGICLRMFSEHLTVAAGIIFREFLGEQQVQTGNNVAPGSTDQPGDGSKPLHENIHKDDLRLESAIRVFGRNITVVSQNGNFTMPGALMPGLSKGYEVKLRDHLRSLVIGPAEAILGEFFNQRFSDWLEEKDQRSPKKSYVDKRDWNFASEELASALEQEQPAEREVA